MRDEQAAVIQELLTKRPNLAIEVVPSALDESYEQLNEWLSKQLGPEKRGRLYVDWLDHSDHRSREGKMSTEPCRSAVEEMHRDVTEM